MSNCIFEMTCYKCKKHIGYANVHRLTRTTESNFINRIYSERYDIDIQMLCDECKRGKEDERE